MSGDQNNKTKAAMPRKHADQLSLTLPDTAPSYDPESFIVSEANDAAWRAAKVWIAASEPALIVCGPAGAGKTHLAHLLTETGNCQFIAPDQLVKTPVRSGIVVIDNMPAADPRAFLSAIDGLLASGSRLVLVGEGRPGKWALGLKDLKTRLEAMPRASLEEPDEALIRAVIAKGFRDRQVSVNHGVIDFAAPRLPRTFAAAHAFVRHADQAAMDEKRKITIPLVQKIVDNLSEGCSTA